MFERLDKYKAELAKARQRKAECDARVRMLEKKCQEEEMAVVHEMMKAADITPEGLQKLIAYTKGNSSLTASGMFINPSPHSAG